MAWRFSHLVEGGELDNTVKGRVTGWIRLTGRGEPLRLDLRGDCHPDLAGWRFRILRVDPVPPWAEPVDISDLSTDVDRANRKRLVPGGRRPMNHGADSIAADEFLLRRVHQNHVDPGPPIVIGYVGFRPTIDLASEPRDVAEIFGLAAAETLIVHTADGKVFAIAELSVGEAPNDFAEEIALTRRNQSLRALLAERSREAGEHSVDDVRRLLGLTPSTSEHLDS